MKKMKRAFFALFLTSQFAGMPHAQDLEKVPLGESEANEKTREIALSELERRYPTSTGVLALRDAHSKSHGCAKAIFEVDPKLGATLRVGTFSVPGQQFKAIIRFSNGAPFVRNPDTAPDGRGMAIKLIDEDPQLNSLARGKLPHDILLINHPVFFVPNALEYEAFAEAGGLSGESSAMLNYFVPSWGQPWTWRLRQGLIARNLANQPISSPLSAQYYSMVPYLFGEGRAIKYSARPCNDPTVETKPSITRSNYLSEALTEGLSQKDACFQLLVQMSTGNLEIEDATTEWPVSVAPFSPVGRIILPRQNVRPPATDENCEQLSFNPWNAPQELRPLGGINRARKQLYSQSARYRTERNSVVLKSPSQIWNEM